MGLFGLTPTLTKAQKREAWRAAHPLIDLGEYLKHPKYWLLVKELFPEVFALRARKKKQRERLFLDELTAEMVLKKDKMPEVSCGPFCTSPS